MTYEKHFWKALEPAGYTLNNYNRKEIDQALDIASKKIVEEIETDKEVNLAIISDQWDNAFSRAIQILRGK